MQQLPADPTADTEANMNRLTLLEGRMPETANECVVQVLGHADPVPLGTVVTLPEDTEDIRRTEYTVVGQVQDPQYFLPPRRPAPSATASWMLLCSCRTVN